VAGGGILYGRGMTEGNERFRRCYGPWAFVGGASEGLGEAFARAIAKRGVSLVLAARRAERLESLAAELAAAHGVEARTLPLDLGAPDAVERVRNAAADVEIGLYVHNAAHSPIGRFLDVPAAEHLRVIDVNCRAPLLLAHALAGPMAERGRGGVLLMASLAGLQGSAMVASYAASKAFNLILAESLWVELRERGVDVLACVAGATSTPGYLASRPRAAAGDPLVLTPEEVVEEALGALGGGPTVVPGRGNRASFFVLQRLLPRSVATRLVSATTRKMYEGR